MCGINGFLGNDPKLIKEMNRTINHRGPDQQGIWNDYFITLGHLRLSILDLSENGRQPMLYEHEGRRTIIVFNGEIYNYIEIKENLTKKGYIFKSGTDTEVIMAAYLEYATDCVTQFNGMWAFALYDITKKKLFCSIDRLGIKPFFYSYEEGVQFSFSSELKSIQHAKLTNKEALDLYDELGFIPAPHTMYKDVYKLEAATNLIFDVRTKKLISKETYWEIPTYKPCFNKKNLIQEGKKLLLDAVKVRMRSDVPVGAFLSGGLDSTAVVSLMRQYIDLSKLHTFSVGFKGKYDETKYITIAKNKFGTIHHHKYFAKKDFLAILPSYKKIVDEPFADTSLFPSYFICKEAKKYVTVCLSGDGGDEVFGGYPTHKLGYQMDFMYNLPLFVKKILANIPARKNLNGYRSLYLLKEAARVSQLPKEKFFSESLLGRNDAFKKWSEEKLMYCLKKSRGNISEAIRLYDMLYNTLQNNFLVKVDRTSMAHALEVRSPYLDYRLLEFSQKIPTKYKVDFFRTKILMREIIKDLVPKEILTRGKQGFVPPIDEWILKDRKEKFYKTKEIRRLLKGNFI